MRPFIIVLLVATSALAAPYLPTVGMSQVNINEIGPRYDNGQLVSSYVTDSLSELSDGGDENVYILTIQQILNDLADQPDPYSQAMALSQIIAVLGELSYGIPGDSCDSANLVNAYVKWCKDNDGEALRMAFNEYVTRIRYNIENILRLATKPDAGRFTTGPVGMCAGDGRSYAFEEVWETIISSAGPNQASLINEEYCAAKRLYNAFNIRSNNVGAAVTAASLGPVVKLYENALPYIANFLRAVITGGDAQGLAAVAQGALMQSAGHITL